MQFARAILPFVLILGVVSPATAQVKGDGRIITAPEAQSVIGRYNSVPGGGMIKGEGRLVTESEVQSIVKRYKSIPGGLVLEGAAHGMQWVKTVRYRSASNTFLINDQVSFPSPISPSNAALLAKAIAQDDRIGVSLTEETQIVYGKLPNYSEVAADLKLADGLLGDLILPPRDWSIGYRFALEFVPGENVGPTSVSVFFRFKDFQVVTRDKKLAFDRATFEAVVVPILDGKAPDGGFLPDFKAISNAAAVGAYETNAKHVGANIGYYLNETVVARALAYGQVAAFFRSLKTAGIDLHGLARRLEGAGRKVAPRPTSVEGDLEADWQTYLKEIQGKNAFANWSAPPYDLYRQRKQVVSIKNSD
jgi:hypothetical protein